MLTIDCLCSSLSVWGIKLLLALALVDYGETRYGTLPSIFLILQNFDFASPVNCYVVFLPPKNTKFSVDYFTTSFMIPDVLLLFPVVIMLILMLMLFVALFVVLCTTALWFLRPIAILLPLSWLNLILMGILAICADYAIII
jgi:hypothetical protein